MKALTLDQPWAALICAGEKIHETRSWMPTLHEVGRRIAIHASRRPLPAIVPRELMEPLDGLDLVHGAIVATAVLERVCRVRRLTRHRGSLRPTAYYDFVVGRPVGGRSEQTDPHGDWSPGRWIWDLADVRVLKLPLACPGRQRLWTVPPDIEVPVRGGADRSAGIREASE